MIAFIVKMDEDDQINRSLQPSENESECEQSLSVERIQDENIALQKKLEDLRKKRRILQQQRERQEQLSHELQDRLNIATTIQHESLLDYQSAEFERVKAQNALHAYQHINVTNDCFHIWHDGPFATINGLRLGTEALPPTDSTVLLDSLNASPASNVNGSESRRFLYFSGPSNQAENIALRGSSNVNTKVPWKEVNAALGLVALLLSTLERKPHCGVKFRYEIKPGGSTSKIGVRQTLTSSLTLYNLYYSDDSFQFFGKRNFNTALQYLAQCVADTAEAIRQRDRTIALPYSIEHSDGRGGNSELLIGGLPVSHTTDDIEWTRAMKYLLTDIKHIMIFKPFGLWS